MIDVEIGAEISGAAEVNGAVETNGAVAFGGAVAIVVIAVAIVVVAEVDASSWLRALLPVFITPSSAPSKGKQEESKRQRR